MYKGAVTCTKIFKLKVQKYTCGKILKSNPQVKQLVACGPGYADNLHRGSIYVVYLRHTCPRILKKLRGKTQQTNDTYSVNWDMLTVGLFQRWALGGRNGGWRRLCRVQTMSNKNHFRCAWWGHSPGRTIQDLWYHQGHLLCVYQVARVARCSPNLP